MAEKFVTRSGKFTGSTVVTTDVVVTGVVMAGVVVMTGGTGSVSVVLEPKGKDMVTGVGSVVGIPAAMLVVAFTGGGGWIVFTRGVVVVVVFERVIIICCVTPPSQPEISKTATRPISTRPRVIGCFN